MTKEGDPLISLSNDITFAMSAKRYSLKVRVQRSTDFESLSFAAGYLSLDKFSRTSIRIL